MPELQYPTLNPLTGDRYLLGCFLASHTWENPYLFILRRGVQPAPEVSIFRAGLHRSRRSKLQNSYDICDLLGILTSRLAWPEARISAGTPPPAPACDRRQPSAPSPIDRAWNSDTVTWTNWTNWPTGTVFNCRTPPESDPNYYHRCTGVPVKGLTGRTRVGKQINWKLFLLKKNQKQIKLLQLHLDLGEKS